MEYYYKPARLKRNNQKDKSNIHSNRKINENQNDYKISDPVFIKESQIKSKWKTNSNGPFKITEIVQKSAILLNPSTNWVTEVNFKGLKPYFEYYFEF